MTEYFCAQLDFTGPWWPLLPNWTRSLVQGHGPIANHSRTRELDLIALTQGLPLSRDFHSSIGFIGCRYTCLAIGLE